MMNKVAIIGLGRIGIELGRILKKERYSIMGTTTSASKIRALKVEFDEVEIFDFSKSIEVLRSFALSDYLVITVPPSSDNDYSNNLIQLISFFREINSSIKVIFLSSISVYGNKPREVTENSSLILQTENAKKINEVEEFLLSRLKEQSVILRLGGLVGENRHPVNFMKNKKKISKPYAGVNLVHHDDVCNFISHCLKSFKRGVYNLCCQDHPPKNEYYNWEAQRRGFGEIDFDREDKTLDKIVISSFETQLNFNYKHSSPYDFPL